MPVPRLTVPVALALVLTSVVAAAAPAAIATRSVDLRTQPSFEIVGAAPTDLAGSAIAPAGDVNGDGIDDVIVGAVRADGLGRKDAGAAYVVFGRRRSAAAVRAQPRARIAATSSAQGFQILGARAGSEAGASVAGVGDVNGDGLDDVLVGAPSDGTPVVDGTGTHGTGIAYVVFGKRGGGPVDLAHLGDGGTALLGAPDGIALGASVAGGRDVNGDGAPDLVVVNQPLSPEIALPPLPSVIKAMVHRSAAFVLFGGHLEPGTIDLATLGRRGYRLSGLHLGAASLAQDMNGDGRAEVVLNEDDPIHHTVAHVAFGRARTSTANLLGPHGGFDLTDHRGQNKTATAVTGGGDVDGDGRGDVALATSTARGGLAYFGAVGVVFGAPSGKAVRVDVGGPRLLRAIGPAVPGADVVPDGSPLTSVSIVPDLDGDGRDDLLAGGLATARGRAFAGGAFLFRGRAQAGTIRLGVDDRRVLRLDGEQAGDSFGDQTASAGDFDGDGRPDLLISGSSSTRKGRLKAGAAWVLSGLKP